MVADQELFKVLGVDGAPVNGGRGKWLLPARGRPGRWMPVILDPVPCNRGYHLCRRTGLVAWLGPRIYAAEGRGTLIPDTDKVVCSEARLLRRLETWNERTARLFAADCAEHVLPLFEKEYPSDDRPQKAIEATRNYANAKIGEAAWAAARDAAWAAAGDAAGAAAGAAARAAAGDATRAAAWAATRAAARAAAWDAAWAAAGDATRAAARAAAWAAAWEAEREWQTERLWIYLNGGPGKKHQ